MNEWLGLQVKEQPVAFLARQVSLFELYLIC